MTSNELESRKSRGESFIIANDGQFLGKLTSNIYDLDSILNIYGLYGSQFSSTSITNKYGLYGSPYSSLSPYNAYTSTPPIIYLRGMRYGYLSVNQFLLGCVNPLHIVEWMKYNGL
jgi:hypothetical protein